MTEEFLNLFKRLEELSRKKYLDVFGNVSDDEMKNKTFKSIVYDLGTKNIRPYNVKYDILYYCADVRNVCSHNPKVGNEYIVLPNKYLLSELKKIIYQIENPPKLLEIAIPANKIYYRNINDSVKDTIKVMNDKTYTHIPIYDKEKFVGVFSENALFNYIEKDEIVLIDAETTFEKILPYINTDYQTETIIFVNKNMLVEDAIEKFKELFKNKTKLACIYITEDGTSNGKLLGMITSWDILAKYM